MPSVALFALSAVFASAHDWLVKAGLLFVLYLYANISMNFFFDERMMQIIPISIYLGSKAWFYYVWLFHIHPFVGPVTTATFLACSCTLW